ncbi:MAG: PrsW family glutamic-type intramembrane protease [Patescibacteria group bacterium]
MLADVSPFALLIAFAAGFIPALVWLVFWLFEDQRRPEPRRLVIRTFLVGMIAVPIVLPLEKAALDIGIPAGFTLFLVWATIEELVKLGLAFIFILRSSAIDEPIDIPIYLISLALGFSAVENTLFLLTPIADGRLLESIITGNLRFIGASLIHVLASAAVGGAMAFAFYRERAQKIWFALIGVILAVSLHTVFNFLIIVTGANKLLTVFLGVWVGVIFLLLALERVKAMRRPAWWEKMFTYRAKGVK